MIAFFSRLAILLFSGILITVLITRLFFDSSAEVVAKTPPAERRELAAEFGERVGYGVTLEEAKGSAETRAETRAGNLFVVARVPDNPGQVVLGPLPFGYETRLTSLAGLAILVSCILALVASILVFRRIRALERVAARMHNGDFSARAERDEADALDGIGASLNRLADRVGQLLNDERDLLRTVAHEVRTPISRMHFRVDSITRKVSDQLPKETKGLVSDLEQVDKLFEELLTYVGFDEFHQDRPDLKTSEVNVEESVRRIADEVTAVRDDITVELAADDGARVWANQKLFDRATSNVVLNAMAYGGDTIYIDIRVFEGECVVDVQDTGDGIPESDRPKVIKPFVRLSKRKTKGTGLGLAIVSRIMRLHGGKLHIVDSPKGGASVQLAWQNVELDPTRRRGLG